MQVTTITLDIHTPRILPVGKSPASGIFDIRFLFEANGQRYYSVTMSPSMYFGAALALVQLADEYEASQVVLESDYSTL